MRFSLPGVLHVMHFMVFGSSVGLWVGSSVGFIVGIWLPLRASHNEVILTVEEKSLDQNYASFLSKKAKHKYTTLTDVKNAIPNLASAEVVRYDAE